MTPLQMRELLGAGKNRKNPYRSEFYYLDNGGQMKTHKKRFADHVKKTGKKSDCIKHLHRG